MILCDYDTYSVSYEAYLLAKAIIAENTISSALNFELAYISNTGQKMVSPIFHHILNQRFEILNGPTSLSLLRKPNALIRRSISVPEISSKTNLNDLAEAYFDSMWKNTRRNRLSH